MGWFNSSNRANAITNSLAGYTQRPDTDRERAMKTNFYTHHHPGTYGWRVEDINDKTKTFQLTPVEIPQG